MKKIKITTPENIEVEYTLADLGSRTAAAVIDMLIQSTVILVLGIALFLLILKAPDFWRKYYGWIVGVALLLYAIISYGYFIAMELNMNGMTLGKKVLKLRAIRTNGQSLTLKHSVIRNLLRVFIDMFGIGVVFIFFNKERRRLGDLAASTIVVVEESKDQPVSLESLQETHEHYSYYLSKEEYELLKDYFERRWTMENHEEVREALRLHFTKKFQDLGNLEEWQEFINKL